METLKRYPWPGNVRELENVMEYMVNLAVPGGDLDVDLLPKEMRKTPNPVSYTHLLWQTALHSQLV